MNTKQFLLILAAVLLFTAAGKAQPPNGPGGPSPQGMLAPPPQEYGVLPPPPGLPPLPGLSKEQAEQMQQLATAALKIITPLEYNIAELELRLKAMISEVEPVTKNIYPVIDEISRLRADIMKTRLDQHLAVQKLLTDEQRLIFDRGFGELPPPSFGAAPRPHGKKL